MHGRDQVHVSVVKSSVRGATESVGTALKLLKRPEGINAGLLAHKQGRCRRELLQATQTRRVRPSTTVNHAWHGISGHTVALSEVCLCKKLNIQSV